MSHSLRRHAFEHAFEESQQQQQEENVLLIPLDLEADYDLKPKASTTTPAPTPASKKKVEEIVLTYPFDIKNLHSKEVSVFDDFGFTKQKVYDVSCFSSMKYVTQQLGCNAYKNYPGYQYRVYSYRAICKAKDTTVINKLRVVYSFDHYKKFVHINIELL